MNTKQEQFWQSIFGQEYTNRSLQTPQELDKICKKNYGISRSDMNKYFLSDLKLEKILEVGCNVGSQLSLLQQQDYKNLYGIEIQEYAVDRAKQLTKNINIIQGSVFDLPFKDDYFDLVFTSGVLIHISPNDIKMAMTEIYRVAEKYIWGFEYFSENYKEIEYQGNNDCLWKANFVKMYLNYFPNLSLIKRQKYKYLDNNNVDMMFLLKK